MKKWHINRRTGNPGTCRAEKRGCPYAYEDRHFSSPDTARKEYEKFSEDLAKRFHQGKRPLPELPKVNEYILDAQMGFLETFNKVDRRAHMPVDFDVEPEELQNAIRRVLAGDNFGDEAIYPHDMMSPEDELVYVLTNESNDIVSQSSFYAALVMPYKELRPVLERHKVLLGVLDNGREAGLTYTVKDKKFGYRTFSVYEHRNTDALIINGKSHQTPALKPGEIPYSGKGKNDFWAEMQVGGHRQLSETLGYFFNHAEKGDLEDDQTLSDTADHMDWNAIVARKIPVFREWMEDQYGEDPLNRKDTIDKLREQQDNTDLSELEKQFKKNDEN